jgi:hypothetical protein
MLPSCSRPSGHACGGLTAIRDATALATHRPGRRNRAQTEQRNCGCTVVLAARPCARAEHQLLAREKTIAIVRQDPASGLSVDDADAELRDVLDLIGDACPECPPQVKLCQFGAGAGLAREWLRCSLLAGAHRNAPPGNRRTAVPWARSSVAWKQHVVLVARRKPSTKIGVHQLPRGEVVGANDLRDPPDAGTCDHRRPCGRRD